MRHSRINSVIILLLLNIHLLYAQEILRIEVNSGSKYFTEAARYPKFPPVDVDSLKLDYLEDISKPSELNKEYIAFYQLHYKLYVDYLKRYNGKKIKWFKPIQDKDKDLLKDQMNILWSDYAKQNGISHNIENLTKEEKQDFNKWVKENNPSYVISLTKSYPIISFKFIPDKDAVYIIDSLFVQTLSFDESKGGEKSKPRRIDIEISTTPGDIRIKEFKKSININEENQLYVRFLTPRFDSHPIYREIGDALVQLTFSYYADGIKKYYKLDPFWLTFEGGK